MPLNTHIHTNTGLEIGGIALPNANHVWGNCESLWLSDSPNILILSADCNKLFK